MGFLDDLEGAVNKGLSVGEDLIDSGKEKLGEAVDYGSDKLGDGLDYVGLDKAGDFVHNAGDHIAAGLGATPSEQGLGHTEDPKQLVHGKVGEIRESTKHLKDFYAAFDRVSQGMRKVDSSGWRGEGGDAFQQKATLHPAKWARAADACERAAKALDAYAETVKSSQDKAQDAIDTYRRGRKASETSAKAHNEKIRTYNAKVLMGEDPGPQPDEWVDPGVADRQKAETILEDARLVRNEAASRTASAINATLAHAPAEPPPLSRLGNNFLDLNTAIGLEGAQLTGGIVKGTAGLLNFARGLNPMDPYNLKNPAAYYQNVNMTLAGLVSTVSHPDRVVQAAIDGFKNNPTEFVGRLLPELVGTKGAGFAKSGMRLGRGVPDTSPDGPPSPQDGFGPPGVHGDAANPGLLEKFLDDQFPSLDDTGGGTAGRADGLAPDGQRLSDDAFDALSNEQKHAIASAEVRGGVRELADDTEAAKFGGQHWNDYADSLPEESRQALRDYSGPMYKEMNGYLRGDADMGTPEVLRNIENADKALAGRTVPEDVMVVRGQDVGYLKAESPEDLIGQKIKEPGYLSTSLGDNGAVSSFSGKDAVLHLRVPEGHPAMWMENVSYFKGSERELLLGRDTTYEVTRSFEDGGQWHIYGTVLPKN
ncbi:putative T7SS-secreted protein [Streptomyces sp. NPDC006798]|uniref:putative T7SS-secreted protein n=1 Tax=Streptomyces sp. NPDC006798 TaxID=3155462 RepID=UPI0033D729B6